MKKIIPTVGVLIIQDGKVLLVRHGEAAGHITGKCGLPSGRIEKGETELSVAIRELHEETGLKTSQENLVLLPHKYQATIKRKDGKNTFSLKVFLCKKYEGNLKKSIETTPEWANISDLEKLNLLPNIKKAIDDALAFLKTQDS
jgi:mutator protein MutT